MTLGELDGATATAYEGSDAIARGTLRDSRRPTYIDVRMGGGATGRKPGRIEGSVAMTFAEVNDAELTSELRATVERKRVPKPKMFALEVDDALGTRIQDCEIAGHFGGGALGAPGGWFGLRSPHL